MPLPLQVKCIKNTMCHDDNVDISAQKERRRWELMLRSHLQNAVVLGGVGIQIQTAKVPVHTQGAEKRQPM